MKKREGIPDGWNSSGKIFYGEWSIKVPHLFRADAYKYCNPEEKYPSHREDPFPSTQLQGKKVFVFVHGYNNSFFEVAASTALIAHKLGPEFFPTFFAWPSRGWKTLSAYYCDGKTIQQSEGMIVEYIESLLKSECTSVHILAHSMGNRGVLNALKAIAENKPEKMEKIVDVIFAAPDVDQKEFFEGVALLSDLPALSINVYYTERDKAIKWSSSFRKPRAGHCVPPSEFWQFCNEAITLSDVSLLDLGKGNRHSYIYECDEVLLDIVQIMNGEKAKRSRHPVGYLQVKKKE